MNLSLWICWIFFSIMKFWAEQLRISGDKTFGEMTFGRLDRKPLGLSDTSANNQSSMYPEFKGQFVQDN